MSNLWRNESHPFYEYMDESPAVFTIVKYQVHILSGYIRLCAKLSEHHRLYRHNQERAYA